VIGAEAARELAQRLADVSAFATVAELADLFGTRIIERSPSERALRLQTGHDLVFCSGHVQVPTKADGATDWDKVSRILIVALEPRNA
jgi:Ran GTPase-activating protein (RanGAP) involved in mRNA processing and transport